MRTNLHLSFRGGTCDAAFTFYESIFHTKRTMTMTWGEAPAEMQLPESIKHLIMRTEMPLGSITLVGSDSPPEREGAFAAFDIAIEDTEPEIRRIFAALSEGGSSEMPLEPSFWQPNSPLFGMCRDRFGVDWMLSVSGPQPA